MAPRYRRQRVYIESEELDNGTAFEVGNAYDPWLDAVQYHLNRGDRGQAYVAVTKINDNLPARYLGYKMVQEASIEAGDTYYMNHTAGCASNVLKQLKGR